MGLLGGKSAGGSAASGVKLDSSQLSKSDKLMLLGATLHDMGAGLNHQEGDAIANTQQLLIARQQRALQNAGFAQLGALGAPTPPTYADAPAPTITPPTSGADTPSIGNLPDPTAQPFTLRAPLPQRGMAAAGPAAAPGDPSAAMTAPAMGAPAPAPYQYQLPQRTSNGSPGGFDLGNPRVQSILMSLGRTGVDTSKLVDIIKGGEPDWKYDTAGHAYDARAMGRPGDAANPMVVNNTIQNANDQSRWGLNVPTAPTPGANAVYGANRNIVDWSMPQGATNAIAASNAAEAAGKSLGQMPYAQRLAQADATGKTFGTVFNAPDDNGHTQPMLGADMFGGGAQGGGGAPGAQGGGPGSGFHVGHTLNPGEIEGQKVDYTAGAQTIAGAGEAKIKAVNTGRQFGQALDDALALDTNNLTEFKLGAAKVLRSLGVNNPNMEQFVNTADGMRMLVTQMTMPMVKELGTNPSNTDLKITMASMPGLRTPKQVAAVGFAQGAALQNKDAARQEFFANYAGPPSKAAMQRAWNQTPEAARSIYQDPVWNKVMLDGKPAVQIFPRPYKDGKRYGIFRPGTKFEQIFQVF